MAKPKSTLNKKTKTGHSKHLNGKFSKSKVKKKRQDKKNKKHFKQTENYAKPKNGEDKTGSSQVKVNMERIENSFKGAENKKVKSSQREHKKETFKQRVDKKDKYMTKKRDKDRKSTDIFSKEMATNDVVHSQSSSHQISQKKLEKNKWRKEKPDSLHLKGSKKKFESSQGRTFNASRGVQKQPPPNRPDIWFDDVDMDLIEQAEGKVKPSTKVTVKSNPLVKERSFDGLTNTVAMDCEMVGVGADGSDSILARVSIVNLFGKCVYDKFVKPTERVTDYRTEVSGVRRGDIVNGTDFKTVQKEVSDIITNRILVGHAIKNDLQVLFLAHPQKMIRDTMRYRPFRAYTNGRNPSLKKLASLVLGVEVQKGEHSSVQDAQAAMRLYTMHKMKWEEELSHVFRKPNLQKLKRSKKPVKTNKFVMDLEDSD